jgi:hypothetical protein
MEKVSTENAPAYSNAASMALKKTFLVANQEEKWLSK